MFVHRLCQPVLPHGKLRDEEYDFARKLRDGPLEALGITKELLDRESVGDLNQALELEAAEQARLMQAADFKEGYQAFIEKRLPKFNRP
jgi:2-(1,2-epoxy-1,2-dihydrophenyl)acetyl-CoA isomerase